MVEQAVEHCGNRGNIAEQLAPVVYWTIGSQQGTGTLVSTHDDLKEILGGGVGQLAHSKVVNDEEGSGCERLHKFFASVLDDGVGEVFEEHVGFAVDDAIALLNGSLPNGLGEVTFACAAGAEK